MNNETALQVICHIGIVVALTAATVSIGIYVIRDEYNEWKNDKRK